MDVRGISYAVDDVDAPWNPDAVRRDLESIRDGLHCTAVLVYGRDPGRLGDAAAAALDAGLDVWFQPRLQDRSRGALLEHLEQAAVAAEQLRAAHPGRVVFVAGCEHSLFTRGMIPGPHVLIRLQLLRRMQRLRPRGARRLDALLRDAVAAARRRFHGPVTYAAGYWEAVDWSQFDLIGINLYRFGRNEAAYAEQVRALVRDAAKPVVVTEFGCCPYVGAERAGPAGFLIVRWWGAAPRIKDGIVRDEGTQASHLRELVPLYDAAGVHGAFVFTFAMRAYPHRPDDARHDLDLASFGVVKVSPDAPWRWEPKEAFAELARLYA